MPIALDATYSIGEELSGVGVYSREILFGLAGAHPEQRFQFCYRAHRYLRSYRESLPPNCSRYLLQEPWHVPVRSEMFHALNQRMPVSRFRRSVCTFHDLFVLTGEYSTPEFRARFAEQAKEAAARADLIITVSAFTASQVTSLLGVDAGRIRVIHHGVREMRPRATERENVILHVGAIQKRKNVLRLVQAFEAVQAPEWKLVLAGSSGYGAGEILAYIADSPARERIEVTGYVSLPRLAELYARASIFVFPSLDEGFGMPVLEAMANGVPVIASNRSAIPEVCGGAAILVDASSTDEIASAIEELEEHPERRQKLIQRGMERAANFTWELAVQKTWAVYNEMPGES